MAEDKPLEYYYDLILESEKLIAECKLTREREILNKTNICLLEYKIITAKALIPSNSVRYSFLITKLDINFFI